LENVAAIKSNGLETVLKDMAIMGYDTRWLCLRASDVGAPHHRDRWFALATYSDKNREPIGTINDEAQGVQELNVADTMCKGLERQREITGRTESQYDHFGGTRWWETEPGVGRMVDGVAHRTHRIKALGNGQVPLQVAVAFTILATGIRC
jgi:DNA (cytosine-5)-methyltransferase 1